MTPTGPTKSNNENSGLIQNLVDQMMGAIDKTDAKAALQRVGDLRTKYPDVTNPVLVEHLIRQRCLQAGAVGAVTSGTATIPGLGTVATLVFGVATDVRMTYKIQSELVLEIAAVYGREISLDDKRYIVALVTGMSAGANQVIRKAGAELAAQASKRLAQRAFVKSIPVLGIAASAGVNMLSTYGIGRRAQAYFSRDPVLLAAWDDQMRALTGIDERQLAGWLAESAERSWRLASARMQRVTDAVIVAGQSAGKLAGPRGRPAATRAGDSKHGVLSRLWAGADAVTDAVIGLGQRAANRLRRRRTPPEIEEDSSDEVA
jgi:uncharacterized protein (DUF697 family)